VQCSLRVWTFLVAYAACALAITRFLVAFYGGYVARWADQIAIQQGWSPIMLCWALRKGLGLS
jgi:hypothetical protein